MTTPTQEPRPQDPAEWWVLASNNDAPGTVAAQVPAVDNLAKPVEQAPAAGIIQNNAGLEITSQNVDKTSPDDTSTKNVPLPQPSADLFSAASEKHFWSKGKKIGAAAVAGGAVIVGIAVAASTNKVTPSDKKPASISQTTATKTGAVRPNSSGAASSPTSIPSSVETAPPLTTTIEAMAQMTADEFAALPLTDRLAYLAAKGGPSLTQFNNAQPDDNVLNIIATEQQGLLACYGNPNPTEGVKCLFDVYYQFDNSTPNQAYYDAKAIIEKTPGLFYGGGFENEVAQPPQQGHDEEGNPVTYRDVTYMYSSAPGESSIPRVSRYFLVDVPLPDGTIGHRWLRAYSAYGNTVPASWNQ